MEDEIDLREYIAVLGRRKWTILAVFLAAVLAAGVLSFFILPPVYEATLLLQPAKGSGDAYISLLLQPAKGSGDAYADPNGLTSILESEGFINRVVSGLGLDPRTISLSVKATVVRNSQLVRLSVRAGDPDQAMRIAEALGNAIVNESTPSIEAKKQVLQKQLREISKLLQITAKTGADMRGVVEPLLRQASPTAEGSITRIFAANVLGTIDAFYNALLGTQTSLNLQLVDLQPVKVLVTQRFSTIVAPRKGMNIALAAVLGLMAGVMLAFFQEFLAAPRPQVATGPVPGTEQVPQNPDHPRS